MTCLEKINELLHVITKRMEVYHEAARKWTVNPDNEELKPEWLQASRDLDEAMDNHSKAIRQFEQSGLSPFDPWPFD